MSWDKENLFYPTRPGLWQRLSHNPILILTQWIYRHQPPVQAPPFPQGHNDYGTFVTPVSVVCLSDTHNEKPQVPAGDILIHAGDLTQNGTFAELQAQLLWIASLPHQHKIVIAGNHDLLLDPTFSVKNGPSQGVDHDTGLTKEHLIWGNIIYLDSNCVTLRIRNRMVRIYGCPLTPKYGNWAFQYVPSKDVWENKIPKPTDILVTHGPAKAHLDNDAAGCAHLGREIWRVQPRLSVWGHMHHGRGREDVCWDAVQKAYDAALGTKVGRFAVIEFGVLVWMWRWFLWAVFGVKRKAKGTFINAAIVGHWGVEAGTVVDI
jgi:hypothetical protein